MFELTLGALLGDAMGILGVALVFTIGRLIAKGRRR